MTDSAVYSLTAATIRGNSTLVSYSSLSRSGNPITCLFVLVLQSNEHGCACRCHLTLQWICIQGVMRICAGGISQLTSRCYSVSLSVKQSKLLSPSLLCVNWSWFYELAFWTVAASKSAAVVHLTPARSTSPFRWLHLHCLGSLWIGSCSSMGTQML